MRKFFAHKRIMLVVGALAALSLCAVAYGYFGAEGNGTGTATAATAEKVTISQVTDPVAGLYPGAAKALAVVVHNPNAFAVRTSGLMAWVSGVDKAAGAPGDCAVSNFEVTGFTGAVMDLGPGDTRVEDPQLTVRMKETNVNQDGCQGAVVHIGYSIVPMYDY